MDTQLLEWRRMLNLSRYEVSVLTRVPAITLKKLEEGRVASIQAETLIRVAHAFGASVSDLIPAFDLKPQRMAPMLAAYVRELKRRPKDPSRQLVGEKLGAARGEKAPQVKNAKSTSRKNE